MSVTETAVAVVVKENAIRKLLVHACGFPGAMDVKKWPLKRLQVQAAKLNDMCDADSTVDDPELQAKLEEILAAIESGGTITVEADDEAPAESGSASAAEVAEANKKKQGKKPSVAAEAAPSADGESEANGETEDATAAKPTAKVGKKKTAVVAGDKPLSMSKAAVQVLTAAGKPMKPQEIIDAMANQGLWTSPGGKTPAATLSAQFLTEIKKKGDKSRFVKTAPGTFALNA